MSENPTNDLPGEGKQISGKRDNDRIDVLISAVQSLGTAFQSMSADFQALRAEFQTLRADVEDVKSRMAALENTVNKRSYETTPIWERALAEIAATRAELAELRSELTEIKAEQAGIKAEQAEMKAEQSELRAELAEMRTELKETRTELKAEMKDGFRKLGAKMDVLNSDLLTLRGDHLLLDKRVEELESKVS